MWQKICQDYSMIPANFNADFSFSSKIPIFYDIFRRSITMTKTWKSLNCKRIELRYHKGPVLSMLMTHSTRLFTGDIDGTIHAWDVQNQTYIGPIYAHKEHVSCLAYHGNLLASGSRDREINIYNINELEHMANLTGHTDAVTSLAFSTSEPGIFFSGSVDRTIRIWDLNTKSCIRVLHGQENTISSIIFCPYVPLTHCQSTIEEEMVKSNQAGYLISGSSAQNIFLWDLKTSAKHECPQVMCTIMETNGPVTAMSLYNEHDENSDRSHTINEYVIERLPLNLPAFIAFAGIFDANVSVFSLPGLDRTYVESPVKHAGTIWSISTAPIHSKVVMASGDRTATVWDFKSKKCVTLGGFDSAVVSTSIPPQEEAICFGTEKGTVIIFDLQEFS